MCLCDLMAMAVHLKVQEKFTLKIRLLCFITGSWIAMKGIQPQFYVGNVFLRRFYPEMNIFLPKEKYFTLGGYFI